MSSGIVARTVAQAIALLVLRAGAAAPPLPAQAAGDTVRYTLSVTEPATKLFRLTAEFPAAGEELLASLPAWTPGSYTIENYARNVRNFSASDGSGRALNWDKLDPDTWRIRTDGAGNVRLSFEYLADSLDLDKSKIFDDFAFFNGTNVFLFEPERTARPAALTIELPPGWKVATSLTPGGAANRFVAPDYDRLVDAPTFLGKFQLDAFEAGGKPARLAVYPTDAFSPEERERIREILDQILTQQNAVVGDAPYDSYTVLLYVGHWGTGLAGGLEHASSHFDILDPAFAEAFEQVLPILESLLAHETFHLWNVKRIRPAAMWPYDYDEWQPTELLWFSEGVTDYYADLSLARSGLYTTDEFFGQIESNLTRLESEPAAIAVEDASLNTWLNPTFGDPYVYYPKGSLIGLLLDLRIRHASGNRRSLDTVMRELYAEFYRNGRGFTTKDLFALVAKAGDGDVGSFYDRYITGRDPLPVRQTLALGGMRLERQELSEPFLGVSGSPTAAGEVEIGAVLPGSPAGNAGVQPGDVLLAVGDVEVAGNPAWTDAFRESYAGKADAPLAIRVRRKGVEQVLETKVGLRTRVAYEVTRDRRAGRTERAILESLVSRSARGRR